MAAESTSSGLSPFVLQRALRRLWRALRWQQLIGLLPLVIVALLLLILAAYAPSFFTERNLTNIFVQASPLALMTIGMSIVMIGGGIDLSIPSIMALSAIAGAMHLRDGGTILVACTLMLGVGLLAGAINGFAVAYLKMIPFVVTLAMMTIAAGTAIWVTNSVSIPVIDEQFFSVILDRVLGIPRLILIMAAMGFISTIFVSRSLFGRWLYAVGTNARAARIAGIPGERVIFGTYLLSGLFAGLTGIVLSARLGSASANMGNDGLVLDIVSSAVVGGISIYGGTGSPFGAVLGAIFITLISNSMNALQVSFFTGLMIKGALIIAFVALDALKKRQSS